MKKNKETNKTKKSDLAGKTIYIYHDSDHGKTIPFSTLKAAKEQAEVDWESPEDDEWKLEWEDCGHGDWTWGEYAHVWTRKIKE